MTGSFTEAALLREVARVQHDKTIQAVRDLVDSIATTKRGGRDNWNTLDRSAKDFRKDLVAALQQMREAAQ